MGRPLSRMGVVLAMVWLSLAHPGRALGGEAPHRVEPRRGRVHHDGQLQAPEQESTLPSEVASLAGGKIRILSKSFVPPLKWAFRPFPPQPPKPQTHVDIWADPEAMDTKAQLDTPSDIKILGTFPAPANGGNFPLRGEGNLQPPAGGQGAPREFHWAAKVADFRMVVLFQTALMRERNVPPKIIPRPDYQRLGVLVGDTVRFSVDFQPARLDHNAYVWTGVRNGVGPTIDVLFARAGTLEETVTVQGISCTVETVVWFVGPRDQWDWIHQNPAATVTAKQLWLHAREWAVNNQDLLNAGRASGLTNTRADAARHAYWSALMTQALGAERTSDIATAHERSNLDAGGNHNESVMDLLNNATGRALAAGLRRGASEKEIQDIVIKALNAGFLWHLDDPRNAAESGLLQPTNK